MDNARYLYAILLELDEYVEFKKVILPSIYLFGGTACILGGYIERVTTDFDYV